MARKSETGVRGLYREAVRVKDADGNVTVRRCWKIDLRWREPATRELRRHRERLPQHVKAAEAKERARGVLNAALKGGFVARPEEPKRLSDVVEEYLDWAKGSRPATAHHRRSLLGIIQAAIGDVRLDDLSTVHVKRLKDARRRDGTGNATINRAVAQLKHLCSWAADLGKMRKETALAIEDIEMEKEPPGRVRYLVGDEAERLFSALPEVYHPLVLTALLTGMRLGEVWSLRKSEVDLQRKEISRIKTKNGKVRHIPINAELEPVLKASIDSSTSELVFQYKGTRSKGTFQHVIKKAFPEAVEAAGIKNLVFHDTRHDFATKLRGADVGLDVIQKLVGHSSLAMVLRYAHLNSKTLHAAVASLPSPLRPTNPG